MTRKPERIVPSTNAVCVGCYQFGQRLTEVAPDRWRCDACSIVDGGGAWRVVAAWGVHGALRDRGAKVHAILKTAGVEVHHLGLTKHGHPKHPLYLLATTELVPWRLP